MQTHKCHAIGCDKQVGPIHFMCLAHWSWVPLRMKKVINLHYGNGSKPTTNFSRACAQAVRLVLKADQQRKKSNANNQD